MTNTFTVPLICLLICTLVSSTHSIHTEDEDELEYDQLRKDIESSGQFDKDLRERNDPEDDDEKEKEEVDEEDIRGSTQRDPFFIGKIRVPIRRPRNFRRPSNCHIRRNQCGRFANGCGPEIFTSTIGRVVQLPYGNVFRGACNKHDSCYDCIAERGWSQKQCDKRFLYDLIKRCRCTFYKWHHAIARQDCENWTRAYYAGVRAGGSRFVGTDYNRNCLRSCMLPLASPHYVVTE